MLSGRRLHRVLLEGVRPVPKSMIMQVIIDVGLVIVVLGVVFGVARLLPITQ